MDLAYPSQRDPKLTQNLSQLDKMYRSIIMSVKDMPMNVLPKNNKSKICKFLAKDQAYKLSQYLVKEAIPFHTEVGTTGSHWNILHVCIKNNAVNCLEFILKNQYQDHPQTYLELVNLKTVENYTPLVIAIINHSDECLEKLLFYGGVDINLQTYSKMTANAIAFNIKNAQAIQLLAQYQGVYRKRQYINAQKLAEPLILLRSDQGFCERACGCLLSCFSLGAYGYKDEDSSNKPRFGGRISSLVSAGQEVQIDYVQIGSRKQLPGYDIQWKRAAQVINHHNVMLFDKCNPFGIIQNNFTLKHNLIIFQQVSKHSFILRKLITPDKTNPNLYDVHIFPNMTTQKVKIDDHIPFIKERNQPMFFADHAEMWPMLVQKALAKWHQGYLNLANVPPKQLMTELTGAYTFSLDIEKIEDLDGLLYKLNQSGYSHILYGKKNSPLSDQSGTQQCFSVLNFFHKGQQKYALINCPFIQESWQEKQKYEQMKMKVIKGYYSPQNQMCVWIPTAKFDQYFSKLIISYTLPNYQRSQLKISTNKYVFWKFRIDTRKDEDTIVAMIDANSQETYDLNERGRVQIYRSDNFRESVLNHPNEIVPKLAAFSSKPGEYMCKYQFNENEQRNLIMLCWSVDYTQLQFVEQQFGVIQWLENWRKSLMRSWPDGIPYKINKVGQICTILLRQKQAQKINFRRSIDQNCLFQGKYVAESGIEMIKQGDFFYIVFKGQCSEEDLKFDVQV